MDRLVAQALLFAAESHRNQRRKDEALTPYINHPIMVMHILRVEGDISDSNVLAAALLHDTLEDTDATRADLESLFGGKIASIVAELTDDQSVPRAQRYAEQQAKIPLYSPEARLVRLADRIANLRDLAAGAPPAWSQERIDGHIRQAHLIVSLLRGTHAGLESLFDTLYAGFTIESL